MAKFQPQLLGKTQIKFRWKTLSLPRNIVYGKFSTKCMPFGSICDVILAVKYTWKSREKIVIYSAIKITGVYTAFHLDFPGSISKQVRIVSWYVKNAQNIMKKVKGSSRDWTLDLWVPVLSLHHYTTSSCWYIDADWWIWMQYYIDIHSKKGLRRLLIELYSMGSAPGISRFFIDF